MYVLYVYCVQSSVLERLLQLPSSGAIDWDTPLSLWNYYCNVVWKRHGHMQEKPVNQTSGSASLNTSVKETKPEIDSSYLTPGSQPGFKDTSPQLITGSSADTKPNEGGSQPGLSSDNTSADTLRTFRVTCVRGGRKHSFTSMEAAGKLGAGLAGHFGWKVQMKNADIEVLLNISGDSVVICFALNRESKSNRNIAHFGPTTLRSAIAYGLLR